MAISEEKRADRTVSYAQSADALTKVGHCVNGAITSALALFITQPLFACKTYAMTGRGWPPVSAWYAGYFASSVSGVPAGAVRFGVYAAGMHMINTNGKPLSNSQNLAFSLASGIVGSPINAVFEHIMIRQQLYGGSFAAQVKSIYGEMGKMGFCKGILATAGRDAVSGCGVFIFNDTARLACSSFTSNPVLRDTLAGLASGVVVGVLSAPFDRCKTLMQQDSKGEYLTFFLTVQKIVKSEGIKGLFKGAAARMATIGSLITVTNLLKDRLPFLLPDFFRNDRT